MFVDSSIQTVLETKTVYFFIIFLIPKIKWSGELIFLSFCLFQKFNLASNFRSIKGKLFISGIHIHWGKYFQMTSLLTICCPRSCKLQISQLEHGVLSATKSEIHNLLMFLFTPCILQTCKLQIVNIILTCSVWKGGESIDRTASGGGANASWEEYGHLRGSTTEGATAAAYIRAVIGDLVIGLW